MGREDVVEEIVKLGFEEGILGEKVKVFFFRSFLV